MSRDLPDASAADGHAAVAPARSPQRAVGRAWITPALVAANVGLFAGTLAAAGRLPDPDVATLLDWGANFGPRTLSGQWWRLLTSMFLHFDLVHLGLNMWVLWNVGRLVERLTGGPAFAVLYFASGLLGGIASLHWNPAVVSAGASGAVFGVVGALFACAVLQRPTLSAGRSRSLRGSLIGFLGYNLLFGLLIPGIDMAAHLGGLAMGFVSGLICGGRRDVGTAPHRLLRRAMLLAGSAAAVGAAVASLPPPPADIRQQLGQFARLEGIAIEQLDALSNQLQDGLSDDQLARRVQREVQPVWRECRTCVLAARQAPSADQQYLNRLIEYVTLRQRSCTVLVEGLRERNARKIEKFNQLYESANRMAQQINHSP